MADSLGPLDLDLVTLSTDEPGGGIQLRHVRNGGQRDRNVDQLRIDSFLIDDPARLVDET